MSKQTRTICDYCDDPIYDDGGANCLPMTIPVYNKNHTVTIECSSVDYDYHRRCVIPMIKEHISKPEIKECPPPECVGVTHEEESANRRPMTLGELIDALGSIDQDLSVRFDFCYCVPETFGSYRGDYRELALRWSPKFKDVSVSAILAEARGAVGGVFDGFKGGDYRTSRCTPVWVANYGDAGRTGLVGVILDDGVAILETRYIPYD